jgi:hypothetical protein
MSLCLSLLLLIAILLRYLCRRCKLKEDLTATVKQLEKAQSHLLTGEVQANRELSKLQLMVEEKETDVLKLRNTLDWSQNRIMELEQVRRAFRVTMCECCVAEGRHVC